MGEERNYANQKHKNYLKKTLIALKIFLEDSNNLHVF